MVVPRAATIGFHGGSSGLDGAGGDGMSRRLGRARRFKIDLKGVAGGVIGSRDWLRVNAVLPRGLPLPPRVA